MDKMYLIDRKKMQNPPLHKVPERKHFIEAGYSIVSKAITPYIAKTFLTPSMITIISGIFGIIGALLLIPNQRNYSILAGVLIQLFIILDFVDGDIARMKNMCSIKGAWLDTFFDKLNDFIMIICLVIGVYSKTNLTYVWLCGIILMGAQFSNQFFTVYNRTIFTSSQVNINSILINSINNGKIFRENIIIRIGKFIIKHLLLEANTFWLLLSIFAFTNQLFIGLIFLSIFSVLTAITIFFAFNYKLNHDF